MKNTFGGFSRRGPDNVSEELVLVLSRKVSMEFKPLFEIIHENLKARNAASGGEEMLRLRTYDKLQSLVSQGAVKKTGKKYRGLSSRLQIISTQMKEIRAGIGKPRVMPTVA